MKAANAAPRSCMLVGGGSRSSYWNSLLAPVLDLPLDLPEGAEIGAALGAARLAMLAVSAGTMEVVCRKPAVRVRFKPDQHEAGALQARRQRYLHMYSPAA